MDCFKVYMPLSTDLSSTFVSGIVSFLVIVVNLLEILNVLEADLK